MGENFKRNIKIYKEYFWSFYETLDKKTKLKVQWTIDLIKTVERVPKKYFDHYTGSSGIYEIRIEYNSNIYRVFSFFDEGQLIILMNGFQKKSQKAPKEEIEKAEKIKEEYLFEKEQSKKER